jgi:hypothetical protein
MDKTERTFLDGLLDELDKATYEANEAEIRSRDESEIQAKIEVYEAARQRIIDAVRERLSWGLAAGWAAGKGGDPPPKPSIAEALMAETESEDQPPSK